MVVTTPSSQHHELGALIVAAIARIEGWNTVYLGPNLPAEEIAAAAKQRRARAVALSVTFPGDDPQLPTELRRLARSLEGDVTLLVGGSSAECYRRVLAEIRATVLDDLSDLRGFLRAARMPASRAES
jgi:methanogenic corrinoid protein MtbC1